MADDTYEFTDSADNSFIDWDCVWSSWVFFTSVIAFAFVAVVIEQLKAAIAIEELNVSVVES